MEREVPSIILKQKQDWMRGHVAWISIHWFLGGAATLAGALVAFSQQYESLRQYVTILGVVACAASALTMFCKPGKRGWALFKAHRILNNAIVRYQIIPDSPVEDLVAANERGEEIIETADE